MTQKITSITVRDYKGVRGEITLKPSGSLVVIAGANGSGKSSLIDAVAEIFDPKGTRLTSRPINDSAEEASAEVITTEARLVRTWKKNDAGTLSAYALDGAKYPSGKDFVLEATGGALFDASEFIGMDAKEQRAQLLARVDLPFDLAEIDAKRKGFFDARTDVTREVKALTAQLAGFPALDLSVPLSEVSATAILAEYETARLSNAQIQKSTDLADELDRHIEDYERQIVDLGLRLTVAKEGRDSAREAAATSKPINTDEITARLSTVEDTNALVRAQQARAVVVGDLANKVHDESDLTAKIEGIDTAKVTGLKSAVFPIVGLSIDDDGITFDGVPFRQVNTAKKIEIAFDLMTQQKPDLRLVMVKDGDSLDAESLAGIDRVATERGYLVLVERDRDESREIGFTIAEGQLA